MPKIEVELIDFDPIVIATLQESVRACMETVMIPADKQYAEEYRKHINFVLDHFGGEPVPETRSTEWHNTDTGTVTVAENERTISGKYGGME